MMERTLEQGRQKGITPRGRQAAPDVSASHPVLQLQQHTGNQTVQQLLRAGAIRAKLAISHPGDREEREADDVADRVMRSPDPHSTEAPCPCMLSGGEPCEACKQKAAIQRQATRAEAPSQAPRIVNSVLKTPGHPLDGGTRSFFETRFGRDFGHVRVHADSSAAASARSINALAYTAGNHLVFGQGQYAPHSPSGAHLLAHELTHVVQQSGAGSIRTAARLSIDTSGEANANQVTSNIAAGRPPGSIDFKPGPMVQRWAEFFAEQGGKFGELGKLGEFGKSSPGEFAKPVTPPSTPSISTPTSTPTPTPGPWANPYPVPPVVPFPKPQPFPQPQPQPQPQPDPDDDRTKDPECGSKKLPLTMLTYWPGPLGQGKRAKASPLTKCPGNTRGTEPDGSIYGQEFACIGAAKETGSWVRAHLVHGKTSSSGPFNLHGPGYDIRNLIISDKSINGLMRTRAEKFVIPMVYKSNAVMWYNAEVDSYVPGKESFAQSITVSAGIYDTNTNTEGPAIPEIGGTYPLKKTPPDCPPPSATPAPPTPAEGITPAVPAGAVSGTPNKNLEFQSYFTICLKELTSRSFKVENGGLEVRLFGEWFDSAVEKTMDASDCPIDHYYLQLEHAGLLWGYHDYDNAIRIPVGQAIEPLRWKGLSDNTYRLRIYVEGDHPSCCLNGNMTVSTFSAPRSKGGEDMIA